jgi:hypothetical protein
MVQPTGHGTADSTVQVNQSHESAVVSRSTEDALPGGDANPHARGRSYVGNVGNVGNVGARQVRYVDAGGSIHP